MVLRQIYRESVTVLKNSEMMHQGRYCEGQSSLASNEVVEFKLECLG